LDTKQLNSWLTLLANVSVLVGIIFLALEIRQSNRIALATTEMSIWDKHQSLNQIVMADDGVAELLVKVSDANAEISALEEEKLYAYLYANINTWLAVEVAHENGMLSGPSFDVIQDDITNILRAYPALRPIMRRTIDNNPAFGHSHVYSAMRQALEDSD
jgi:hypothetical protein